MSESENVANGPQGQKVYVKCMIVWCILYV